MTAALDGAGCGEEQAPPTLSRPHLKPGELPASVAAALWRGTELGSPITTTVSSGFKALDAELPGGGWPCHSLTEILQAQPALAEWRLVSPAMRQVMTAGGDVVVVGPPQTPHLPGLRHLGLDDRRLIWIQADAPAQRLWVTEQLVKVNAAGLLIAWLPQARQEQIRRLQSCAASCTGPVLLCRPASAKHEASAAPLRVELGFGIDWELHLHVLKRKGPNHEGVLKLESIPGGLEAIITPRLRKPSAVVAARRQRESVEAPDVVGSSASRSAVSRRIPAH